MIQPIMHVEHLYTYLLAIPIEETSVHILSMFLFYFLVYSFLAVPGVCCCMSFSLAVVSTGFSLRWRLPLWSTGSGLAGLSFGSQALEQRLSSCDGHA